MWRGPLPPQPRQVLGLRTLKPCIRAPQASLAFPAVLQRLGLAPFDLAKLVHPFQSALPALPAELNRHLFLLEERILEVRLLVAFFPFWP